RERRRWSVSFPALSDGRVRRLTCKDLGHVTHLYPFTGPPEPPCQMQEAAEISPGQEIGARGLQVSKLGIRHGFGDMRVFDGKKPTEAAAFLGLGQFVNRDSGGLEKTARLLPHRHVAEAGTGVVIAHLGRPRSLRDDLLRRIRGMTGEILRQL